MKEWKEDERRKCAAYWRQREVIFLLCCDSCGWKKAICINLSRLIAAITWRCWLSWLHMRTGEKHMHFVICLYSAHSTNSLQWVIVPLSKWEQKLHVNYSPQSKNGFNEERLKDSFHRNASACCKLQLWWKAVPRVKHLHLVQSLQTLGDVAKSAVKQLE